MTCLWPGALAIGIYLLTLAPTVTGEDSGELITAAYHFGVPHPPGYPLWTMLCGLWLHILPFGSIAWRANLFSAACMAGAVVFLFAALRQMRFRALLAGSAAAACGLTAAAWSQSVIAEVYTLNLLLTAMLLWAFARWHREGRNRWLLWASFFFGLGMANHQIIGFTALALGIWALARQPRLLGDARLVVTCAILFAVGLLPYVYLLWAGQRDVPVKWGETSTLAGAWEQVSRGQYKSETSVDAKLPMTAGLFAGRLYYGLRWEVRQFTPILVPLLLAGLTWLWQRRSRRTFFWQAVALGICSGPLLLYVAGPQLDRQDEFVGKVFLTPLALVSGIPLAAGLQWLLVALRPLRRTVGRIGLRIAVSVTALGVIAVPLIAHWRENNLRHYWYARDHAENMLACMLPNAIIFPSGDHNTFPLIYLIHVEGRRPDVIIADKYGYIDLDLYRDMPDNPGKPRTLEERERIEEWIIRHARRPVYFTVKKPSPVENAKTIPVGLLYHLLPEGKEFDATSCWQHIRYRNLDGLYAPEDHAAANILADYYYALGMTALEEQRQEEAKGHFERCLQHAWGLKEVFNNVASALAEYGLVNEAIGDYEEAARMDWRYAPARWNLAKIFKSAGQFDWSAKVFEDLTKATPGDFRPYGELGFLYANHLGDAERAKYWWYESLRINPRQAQIIAALAESEGLLPAAPASAPPQSGSENSVPTSDLATFAQSAASQPGVQPTSAPAATTQPQSLRGAGRLEISERVIALGTVVEGTEALHTVRFRNVGTGPLTITGIEASCACVVSTLEKKTYAPGQNGEITVGLKTAGKRGPVTESLTFKSDDPLNPAQKVTLQAVVIPEMTVEPAEIRQAFFPGERPQPFSIVVTNNHGLAFEVQQVASTLNSLHFDWLKGALAPACTLEVSCPSSLAATHDGLIEIHTSLASSPVLKVPLHLELRLPAEVKPAVVYLGRIARDQRVQRAVTITAVRENLTLELKMAEAPPVPGLQARLNQTDQAGTSWVLEIVVDGASAAPGVLNHKLHIAITGCDRSIEVPIYGNVAE